MSGKTLREIYNDASNGAGAQVPHDVVLPCERCGEPVLFHREADTTVTMHHDGCEQGRVTLETLNPRRLGMITGISG